MCCINKIHSGTCGIFVTHRPVSPWSLGPPTSDMGQTPSLHAAPPPHYPAQPVHLIRRHLLPDVQHSSNQAGADSTDLHAGCISCRAESPPSLPSRARHNAASVCTCRILSVLQLMAMYQTNHAFPTRWDRIPGAAAKLHDKGLTPCLLHTRMLKLCHRCNMNE
jgi:hypothetical protein